MFNYNTFVPTFISTKRSGQKGERIREDWNEPLGLLIWHRMIKTNRRKKEKISPTFWLLWGKQSPRNQSADAPLASGVVVVFFFCQLALEHDIDDLVAVWLLLPLFKDTFHMQIRIRTAV